jgi:hypothetical protein
METADKELDDWSCCVIAWRGDLWVRLSVDGGSTFMPDGGLRYEAGRIVVELLNVGCVVVDTCAGCS